jgi:HD-like signal output (HDOD) protein/signal transduction histidine kinase
MSIPDQDIRNRLLMARLPALPEILLKLIELCQTDEAGMAELAKLIANDAGMSNKVLSVANSAAFHRGGRKVGLTQALSTLGIDMLKTLVMSESVLQTFNGFAHTGSTDLRSFWQDALRTAVIAREIAKKTDYPQIEEAYLAGLLHNVGRLALLAAAPQEYGLNFHAQDNQHLCRVEHSTLQIAHTEAGAWLVERWKLDSFLADSIRYHHEPVTRIQNAHPLIRIVHLAHSLNSLVRNDAAGHLELNASGLCQISSPELLVICQGATAQVTKAASYLGIDLSSLEDSPKAGITAPTQASVETVQQRLIQQVCNLTLTTEMGQSLARQKNEVPLLDTVRQYARLRFNLEDAFFLLVDEGTQTLVGLALGEQQQRLDNFSIALAHGGKLAQSVLQKQLTFVVQHQATPSLAEEQLLRIFDTECLVCVPLISGERCLGVMISGIAHWRVADLTLRDRLIHAFGTQAGIALESATLARSESNQQLTRARESYMESARQVAHEINNPLAIIKNYLGVLDAKLNRQEPLNGELSILSEELDRVGNLLNDFSGALPAPRTTGTDVNQCINGVVRLFRESKFLPAGVQLVAKLPSMSSEIDAPVDVLKQILLNLIKNAVEALPQGGQIEIVNRGRVQRKGRLLVALSVRDSGSGLPPEVLTRLYSRVPSAKAGENRGLGLSIVHSLITKLGGQIDCQSTMEGTLFELLLPAQAQVQPTQQTPLGRVRYET